MTTDKRLEFSRIIKSLDAMSSKQLTKLGRIESVLNKIASSSVKLSEPSSPSKNKQKPKQFDPNKPVKSLVKSDFSRQPKASTGDASKADSEANFDARPMKNEVSIKQEAEQVSAPSEVEKEQLRTSQETNKLLEGVWRDANGKLRQQNGAFASQKQKELLDAIKDNDDSEAEESGKLSNVFSSLSEWVKGDQTKDTVTDVTGKTIGGSYWAAGVELKDAVGEFKGKLDDSGLGSREDIKSTLSERFKGLTSFFKQDKPESVPSEDTPQTSETSEVKESVSQASIQAKQEVDENNNKEMIEAYDSWQERTLEALEKLDDSVNDVAVAAGGAGGGLMEDMMGDFFGNRDKKNKGRGAKRGRIAKLFGGPTGSKMMAGTKSVLGSGLAKIAIPLTALVAGFSKYNEVKDKEELSQNQKTAQVASTATGALGGAAAGAATGAAIGSVVPVIGTVIGGVIGGAIGGWLGKKGGELVGDKISDSMASPADKPSLDKVTSVNKTMSEQIKNDDKLSAVPVVVPSKNMTADSVSSHFSQRQSLPNNPSVTSNTINHNTVTNNPSESNEKLIKAIDNLSKQFSKEQKVVQKTVNNEKTIRTMAKSSGSQVPNDFSDHTLKLIAADID